MEENRTSTRSLIRDLSKSQFNAKLREHHFRAMTTGLWYKDLQNPGHTYGAVFRGGALHHRLTIARLLGERDQIERAKVAAVRVEWGSHSAPFQGAANV